MIFLFQRALCEDVSLLGNLQLHKEPFEKIRLKGARHGQRVAKILCD